MGITDIMGMFVMACILITMLIYGILTLLELVVDGDSAEDDGDEKDRIEIREMLRKMSQDLYLMNFGKHEQIVRITKLIEELRGNYDMYPEDMEVPYYRYKETFEVVGRAIYQLDNMVENEETLNTIESLLKEVHEGILEGGLDKRVSDDLKKELKVLQDLKKQTDGRFMETNTRKRKLDEIT